MKSESVLKWIDGMRSRAAARGYAAAAKGPVGVKGYSRATVSVDEENGNNDIILRANTDQVDLDREVVVPSGADTTYFFENRVIFSDHQTDVASVVAGLRSASLKKRAAGGEEWLIRVRLIPEMPQSGWIKAIAREVGIGCSIGFLATEYGPPTGIERKAWPGVESVVRRWPWLETSFTPMPCSVTCGTTMGEKSVKIDKSRQDGLDRMLRLGHLPTEAADWLGMRGTATAPQVARKRVVFL